MSRVFTVFPTLETSEFFHEPLVLKECLGWIWEDTSEGCHSFRNQLTKEEWVVPANCFIRVIQEEDECCIK
jgi:hypothetical protein